MKGDQGLRRLVLPLVVLVSAVWLGAIPATASAHASARVVVELDRHLYTDGVHRASFEVDGTCVEPVALLNLSASHCSALGGSYARGSIRSARLGFDAAHSVEALPYDAPFTDTDGRLTETQTSTVRIELEDAAQLLVRVTAPAIDGADPVVMQDTARPAATGFALRSAEWGGEFAAGSHVFSVGFALTAEPDATYVPEVRVTRTSSEPQPLESLDGGAGPSVTTNRISTLVLGSRAHHGAVPPTFGDGRFYGATDRHGLHQAFGGQIAFDVPTDYHAARMGEVAARFDTSPSRLAPGSDDALNSQLRSITADTESKVDLLLEPRQQVGLRTARAVQTVPVPRADPFAGMLYSGDSVHAGVGVALLSSYAEREGRPLNNDGALALDWAGGTATVWSTTIANRAPAGEPNAWNVEQMYRAGPLQDAFGAAGQILQTVYAIPVTAQGGDIDNRFGDAAVDGPAATFSAPADHAVSVIFTAFSAPGAARVTLRKAIDTGASGLSLRSVTLTPTIGSGGYWLQSTRDGYARDWAGGFQAVVMSSRRGALRPGVESKYLVTVPPGFATHLNVFQPEREPRSATLHGPGVFEVTVGDHGLTAAERQR